MNKKGFTLVEILSVIVLLGLLMSIAGIGVTSAQKKAKEKTLATKVKNIEKAAVLYGQSHKSEFNSDKSGEYCKDSLNKPLPNCYYFDKVITVDTLVDAGLIKADTLTNPLDESKTLNECTIQIYSKYGKIYAVYNRTGNTCWK